MFFKGTVDMDAYLEPRQSGDPSISSTGLVIGGQDIADRYAPASIGVSPSPTFIFKGLTDISDIFCMKGAALIINSYSGRSAGCSTTGSSCQVTFSTLLDDVDIRSSGQSVNYLWEVTNIDGFYDKVSVGVVDDGSMSSTRSDANLYVTGPTPASGGETNVVDVTVKLTITDPATNRSVSDTAIYNTQHTKLVAPD